MSLWDRCPRVRIRVYIDDHVPIFLAVSATCTYGDIRLVNGGTPYEGRIEVCVSNQWGTICDDYWSTPMYRNAQVACRQLGFSDEGESVISLKIRPRCFQFGYDNHINDVYKVRSSP